MYEDKKLSWIIGGMIAFIIGLLWLMIILTTRAMKECEARGGEWVKIGWHLQTNVIPAGKSQTIITYPVDDYGCSK